MLLYTKIRLKFLSQSHKTRLSHNVSPHTHSVLHSTQKWKAKDFHPTSRHIKINTVTHYSKFHKSPQYRLSITNNCSILTAYTWQTQAFTDFERNGAPTTTGRPTATPRAETGNQPHTRRKALPAPLPRRNRAPRHKSTTPRHPIESKADRAKAIHRGWPRATPSLRFSERGLPSLDKLIVSLPHGVCSAHNTAGHTPRLFSIDRWNSTYTNLIPCWPSCRNRWPAAAVRRSSRC